MVGPDLIGEFSRERILYGFDSSGHLDTWGVDHNGTGTVVKVSRSSTEVNSMAGPDMISGLSRSGLENTGILDGVDSSVHLDKVVAGSISTSTVVKFGGSRTGVNSMAGPDLSGGLSRAGLEMTYILDVFDSSGHLDKLVAGSSDTCTVGKFCRSRTGLNSMAGPDLSG